MYYSPTYKGRYIDLPSNTFYGVAYSLNNSDEIKYLVHSEDIFSKFDTTLSKKQDTLLVNTVKKNIHLYNTWLIQYIDNRSVEVFDNAIVK